MPLPLKYNLRNLLVRRTSTALTIFGIGVVVLIFIALGALVRGLRNTIVESGSPDNIMIVSQGAISAEASELPRALLQVVRVLPEVKKGSAGEALVSPELLLVDNLFYPALGRDWPTALRGVEPVAFQVHEGVRVLGGSPPRPNGFILVGGRAADQLGLRVGDELRIEDRPFTVAGLFSAGGTILESEIWMDLNDLQVFSQKSTLSTIVAKVPDARGVEEIARRWSDHPQIKAQARSERDYLREQAANAERLRILGLVVSLILGVGAVFGGMTTMYAFVGGRVREIGTLRAIGFSRRHILLSFLIESLLIALAGGVLGGLLSLGLNGLTLRLLGITFREIQFSLQVSPGTFLQGLSLALSIGILGGFFPARAAARLKVVDAIRAL